MRDGFSISLSYLGYPHSPAQLRLHRMLKNSLCARGSRPQRVEPALKTGRLSQR